MKDRIVAVFPGSSENGLEVLRSLQYEKKIQLISLSSDTHGPDRFFSGVVCKNVPLLEDDGFFPFLGKLIAACGVTHLFPVTSYAVEYFSPVREELSVQLIAPEDSVVKLFGNKLNTLLLAQNIGINTPRILSYTDIGNEAFLKPVVGFGSQGARYVDSVSRQDLDDQEVLVTEFLPGEECTVEVLSDSGGIVFLTGRTRSKVRMGTAVAGSALDDEYFLDVGTKLWKATKILGIWFFQMKRDSRGSWSLLEVDCRVAGSMSWSRSQGVNLPKLALWIFDGVKVDVKPVRSSVRYVRHLAFKSFFCQKWSVIFVDWDDTVVVNGRLNKYLVGFLFYEKSKGVAVKLLSKHLGDLEHDVALLGLEGLFDQVIHLDEAENKEDFMCDNCLFIDDSFSQRSAAMDRWNCLAVGPDVSDLLFYTE